MKKFLSVILAAIILACPLLSGFATEAAQTLEWYFCDEPEYCDPWFYNYKGEAECGDNKIVFTEDDYCDYYTFTVENTGYYYVECIDEEVSWFGFPEGIKDGKAYFETEGYYISGSDIEKKAVYKLNKGNTVLGVDFSDYADADETYLIKIEYLGDAITDIIPEEGMIDNLIINVDVYNNDSSNLYGDVSVAFSGNKTIIFPDESLEISAKNHEWTEGENSAVIEFMDFKKDVVINALELNNVIKDVEFVNVDEHKNVTTAYNDFYVEEIYGAKLIFTLADGTKIEVDTNETNLIELFGREYYFYVAYCYNSADDVDIVIVFEFTDLKSYDCNVTKSTLAVNTNMLFSNIGTNIKDAMYYLRLALSELLTAYDASALEYVLPRVIWRLEQAGYRVERIFNDIGSFFDYYI